MYLSINKVLRALIGLTVCLLLISSGCSSADEKFESRLDQLAMEETLQNIATTYLTAQYEGDLETIKSLTRGEIRQAVENGELDIFKTQELNSIDSFLFQKPQDNSTYRVSVTLTTTSSSNTSSYYENLTFSKYEGKWYIVKAERDI